MDERLKTIALEGAERALPRILRLLEQLCALDSCSGHEPGNRQVIELLRPVLEDLGAQVEDLWNNYDRSIREAAGRQPLVH